MPPQVQFQSGHCFKFMSRSMRPNRKVITLRALILTGRHILTSPSDRNIPGLSVRSVSRKGARPFLELRFLPQILGMQWHVATSLQPQTPEQWLTSLCSKPKPIRSHRSAHMETCGCMKTMLCRLFCACKGPLICKDCCSNACGRAEARRWLNSIRYLVRNGIPERPLAAHVFLH